MLLFGNCIPVLRSNSSFPVKVESCWLMIPLHPKACHIASHFISCKRKLTICHIFFVVDCVSIRRCHLKWWNKKTKKTWPSTLLKINTKESTYHSVEGELYFGKSYSSFPSILLIFSFTGPVNYYVNYSFPQTLPFSWARTCKSIKRKHLHSLTISFSHIHKKKLKKNSAMQPPHFSRTD